MLRKETLGLYQKFLRLTRQISDKKSKDEMVAWIKEDFRLNKHLKEEVCAFKIISLKYSADTLLKNLTF